jgi:hypothetical protein
MKFTENQLIENRIELLSRMIKDEKRTNKESRLYYNREYHVGPRFLQACERYGILTTPAWGEWSLKTLQIEPTKVLIGILFDIERQITDELDSSKGITRSKSFITSIQKAGTERLVKTQTKEETNPVQLKGIISKSTHNSDSPTFINGNKKSKIQGVNDDFISMSDVGSVVNMISCTKSIKEIRQKTGLDILEILTIGRKSKDIINTDYVIAQYNELYKQIMK